MNVPLELCIIRVTMAIMITTASEGTTEGAYPFIECLHRFVSHQCPAIWRSLYMLTTQRTMLITSTSPHGTMCHNTTRRGRSQQNVVIYLQNIFVTRARMQSAHMNRVPKIEWDYYYFINLSFGLIGCRATYSNMKHCSHFQRHTLDIKCFRNPA